MHTGSEEISVLSRSPADKIMTHRAVRSGVAPAETVFQSLIAGAAVLMVVLVCAVFLTLVFNSLHSIKEFGFRFFYGTTWNPVTGEFGALPFLAGTLITSFLALAISLPFSLALAIHLGEYSTKGTIAALLQTAIELLAGIPSVIYGFWGLFVLVPMVRSLERMLGVNPVGVGIFTASLVLAIMIIPYSSSLGREVIRLVPDDLKEAAYSLGATRFEVVRKIVIPYVLSGITAGNLLALGRAIGETMAVTMVIGNSNTIPTSIFAPANTMASVIANEFTEATDHLYLSSLIEIGLLLFVVTMIINVAGKQIIKKMSIQV